MQGFAKKINQNYVLGQRKHEGVQWRAPKLVPSVRDEPYIDQLTSFNLSSLLYRFRRGDLIFAFKLLSGYFELRSFLHYLTTRIPDVIHLIT